MRTTWIQVAGIALAVGALACGSDDEPTDTSGSAGSTGTPSGSGGDGSGGMGAGAGPGSGGSATGGDGSGGDGGARPDASASADIEAKSGSNAAGTAMFTLIGTEVTLVVDVTGVMPAGNHGIHVHETGDCSSDDAMSAGGHWNPEGHDHGMLGTGHLGDIGNIAIAEDGTGHLEITTELWSVGDGSMIDVVGHAIVLHENEDDQTSTAMPGARIGCGVIQAL